MTNANYQSIPIQECGEPLVDLAKYPFILEPKYFQQGFSDSPSMLVREGVANKLMTIQGRLAELQFKIWDAWRSREVQNRIYQKYWNDFRKQHPAWDEERLKVEVGVFVTAATDPARIPPHATGGAVDLTLVDIHGQELNMGTGFDHIGPEATALYFDLVRPDPVIAKNRKFLRDAMIAEDISFYDDEWWHFDYGNQFWAMLMDRPVAVYGEMDSGP